MTNLLKENSYHVLGLDISASPKDISRRSNEIINRLKIDDVPEYPLDIGMFDNFRTEQSAKDASQKLQIPKKQIKEYFFWFQIADDIDEAALNAIKDKSYSDAINIWKNAIKNDETKSLFYKKNLAILYCLLLSNSDNKSYLIDSLSIWKEMIDSEKFWLSFSKLYHHHNEHVGDNDFINEFRGNIGASLSDIYTELHHKHKKSDYINEFHKLFSVKGNKVEESVLLPIYSTINSLSQELEKIKVSEDGVFDDAEDKQITNLISSIQNELKKLLDIGLYDDTQTKIVRDRIAESIKVIVLDLHNNLDESSKALSLLKVALSISGTSGQTETISHEIKFLENMLKNKVLIEPINELINKERYDVAYNLICSEIPKHKDNLDLQEYYAAKKKECIASAAIKKWVSAHENFHKGNFEKAKDEFAQEGDIIYKHINLFNFNKEIIDKILAEMKSNMLNINLENMSQFDEYRSSFIKRANSEFEGKYEEQIFIALIDSYFFDGVIEYVNKTKKANTRSKVENTVIQIIVWIIVFAVIVYLKS